MTKLRAFLDRVSMLFRRSRVETDIDEEICSHLEMEEAHHLRRGMNPDQARRAALRNFGGIDQVKERYRDHYRFQSVESFLQDVRFAMRTLRKNSGFTAVAVTMLAVGIGVNAAVFTVTNAVLFKGFPLVDRNDRIVYMTTSRYCCVSYPDFEDWRTQAKSFEGMAIVRGVTRVLSDKSGFPESYFTTEVSADTFKLLGQRPVIGRNFVSSDDVPGAPPVAILSYAFWESRYRKAAAVIGQTVRLNGVPTTVIGVMPQGFSFPQNQDLWVPLIPSPDLQKREVRDTWFVFGRLANGVTIENARAEMEIIGKRLESTYPLTNQGFLPEVRNFHEFFLGANDTVTYGSMWGAVAFVLLIACANLANLMLGRTIGRSREISLRIALGAGRWRITRQLLLESMVLSVTGGVFGWWIAKWAVHAYELAPHNSSWRVLDYTMDYHVLGYLIVISLGTALLFGLAPVRSISKLDVNATLKDGGNGAIGGGRSKHLSGVLVIGEMALAVVLLAGAGLMIRSFVNIYTADVGVKAENVLTMWLRPDARYSSAAAQISFYERLKTRLEAIPGVESVALANRLPTANSMQLPYELSGAPFVDEQRRPKLSALVISPAYFRTLEAAVLSGREFNDADEVSGIPAVIVNQAFAMKYWPGETALGKRLRLFDGKTPQAWLTVVGVVSNIAQNSATREEFDPLVYLPYRQIPPHSGTVPAAFMYVIARTRIPPGSLATAFRREVQAIDSDLPIWSLSTLTQGLESNYRPSGINAILFLIFAAIALLLASLGLYAVIAHSMSQRTQEIGIRMAMGATARDILKLVFRQGMLPVGIGLTIGLTASFAVNRLLRAELIKVSPSDPITLIGAASVLILAAMLGCLIPALRAMRVDPLVALRHE